jgi:hypothetical protein
MRFAIEDGFQRVRQRGSYVIMRVGESLQTLYFLNRKTNHQRPIRVRAALLAMTIATGPSFPVAAASPPALTDEQVAKLLIYSPRPKYPSLAQRQLIRATRGYYTTTLFPPPEGIFILRVHIKTGRVKEVVIERSTGEPILDVEVVRAFK